MAACIDPGDTFAVKAFPNERMSYLATLTFCPFPIFHTMGLNYLQRHQLGSTTCRVFNVIKTSSFNKLVSNDH